MKHIKLFEQFITEASGKRELNKALKLAIDWTARYTLQDGQRDAAIWASEQAPGAESNWKRIIKATETQRRWDVEYMEKAQQEIDAANFQDEAADLISFVQKKWGPAYKKESDLKFKISDAKKYDIESSDIEADYRKALDQLKKVAKKYDKMCKDLGLETPANVDIYL